MRMLPIAAVAALIAGSAIAQTTPHTVYFGLGATTLDAQARQVVDAAAADWRATGSATLEVVGHTDTTGSVALNQDISRRRASAVAEALADRGVPPNAIETASLGQDALAISTGDNVAERRNRRVEITLAQPAPPPAPTPAPAPAAAVPTGFSGITFGVGPYVAGNLQDGDNSLFLGANFTASLFATPNVALSAEQAVFYNLGADDEGWGGRSAAGADWYFAPYGAGGRVLPYVGGNIGYTYIGGSGTGGWFAGPEIGLDIYGFKARVAYDIFFEKRDVEEGAISATIGYVLHF